ncbi:AMP-binding protein [Reichenbachiella agarivorans]|uniref:AMP-binding protein n=1 Tax=Reichenbachiella agarivorans TaxID=2979464 RepID=A0ABY6CNE6_9BACT|nr:AMP-binding protein [Reichenbachiella agarivorans]UXP32007.1 AMP-binding protein [Reichenbachiella agarivorans]
MKIIFQNTIYSPDELNQLSKTYLGSQPLCQFISHWLEGHSDFTFQTSGSTGIPKNISVQRRQIEASVHATADFLNLKASDQVLLCLNPQYIASIMMAARALVLDMDLYIQAPSANPLTTLNHTIDFASFVPFQIYQMIQENSILQLEGIKNVLIGGAPLNQETFDILSSLNNNCYLTYGMTETVSHIALMKISGDYQQACYDVLDGIKIGNNDEQCLQIQGVVTNDQWIQTTDVVELISERQFRWLGRADHVINSGGIKIHPEQLEKYLSSLITTGEFFIGGISDSKLNERCVLVTESPMSPDKFVQIQESVAEHFSKHHVPKAYFHLPTFIKTESGKLKRKEMLVQIEK